MCPGFHLHNFHLPLLFAFWVEIGTFLPQGYRSGRFVYRILGVWLPSYLSAKASPLAHPFYQTRSGRQCNARWCRILASSFLLMPSYISVPGHVSVRAALDAKAEPWICCMLWSFSGGKLVMAQRLVMQSLCEQASNTTCFVMSCCRNSCCVLKWKVRCSFSPLWRKSSSLCSIRGLLDWRGFVDKRASTKSNLKHSSVAARPLEGTSFSVPPLAS